MYASCPCEWEGRGLTSCSLSGQTTDDADDTVGHKSFISATVQTGFCDWSAKYFAQPVMKVILCYLCACLLNHGTAALEKCWCPERRLVAFSILFAFLFLQSGEGKEWTYLHHAALGSCVTTVLVK